MNKQTSIIGKEEVDIYVENNTHVEGAVIAAENGNLKLNTNTLTYNDINDHDTSEGYQIGLSGSKSAENAKNDERRDGKDANGDTGKSGDTILFFSAKEFVMARLARVVAPGQPHHITQRGNRRQQVFFCDEDYQVYLDLMCEWCAKEDVEIWAYCLMPNHVHLIAVPDKVQGLARAIGEAHRRYTRHINFREGWRGYLWQGRFASFVMDERHCLCAARYIELNPVRAGLCKKPEEYKYSSASAHLAGRDDALLSVGPLLGLISDWSAFLQQEDSEGESALKRHEHTGRPAGDDSFLSSLEKQLGRIIKPGKPGRPKKK